jgi:hypothetical protein
MTPEDVWRTDPHKEGFELPAEDQNGERQASLGRSAKARAGAGGRFARTLRRPFRAEEGGAESVGREDPEDTPPGEGSPGKGPDGNPRQSPPAPPVT